MGLHNKFPSYFYKRGNLFNTYLGYTAGADVPATPKTPTSKRRRRAQQKGVQSTRAATAEKSASVSRPKSPSPARPFASNSDAQQFVQLARQHLTVAEAGVLLRLISADRGQPLTPSDDARVWEQLAYFCSVCLPRARVTKFKATLERRLELGEPLIQKA